MDLATNSDLLHPYEKDYPHPSRCRGTRRPRTQFTRRGEREGVTENHHLRDEFLSGYHLLQGQGGRLPRRQLRLDHIARKAESRQAWGVDPRLYQSIRPRISAISIGHHFAPIDSLIPMRLATRCTRAAFGTLTCSSLRRVHLLHLRSSGLIFRSEMIQQGEEAFLR